ncbi:glycerol-3-phosphate acyltransferase [Synechocystis sp. PCC 7509]|uniref:glycerol-3-phosphate acyltransferase n=1 Tax=Synechocystis sp. PCC 7509 TaxID=927677 RepID=UPI0002ACFAEB|nr:glycerol-3-phosphate acyltransferase [Synechocystis sp. PCC 7509]
MLNEVWGALVIFFILPILGGLPLIAWFTYAVSRQQLTKLGTGNISVSAAFYHGGKIAGILAVISEATKGIVAVLVARTFFPTNPTWEIIALIALVMGRYWIGKGAGATNVVWGYLVHDWRIAALSFLIGGVSFTVLREREIGRFGVLVLFPILTMLLHANDSGRIVAAISLAVILGWIYKKLPDDLDLSPEAGQAESQATFRFFQGSKTIVSLDAELEVQKAGQKAATLSKLKRLGYPVPQGWLLPAGDDLEAIVAFLHPSTAERLVVRSSAVGEDSETASAAGQYDTVLNVTSQAQLRRAISRVIDSYDNQAAIDYRRHRAIAEDSMAVLIQKQVLGVFSGVAFSRDPVARTGDWVVIEALPGDATKVVSGQFTPEQYRVYIAPTMATGSSWVLPEDADITVEGIGDVPQKLIKQVAFLARHLESCDRSIPQDIEWSYDGETLWLLQSRPITTLLPIWTRKIASEVIPGLIRPLTWSINRPLTCGVWGEIFTIVLGSRASRLDFNSTATLHYSRAYFNASLLGEIFRRMGLPPESLEFLTRGAKFSKPPVLSTLQNVPGLMRLLGRELKLKKDFERDYRIHFSPALARLERDLTAESPQILLAEVDLILELLKKATYYSIMSPLSAALRFAVFKVQDRDIDNSLTPEVSAINAIARLATEARKLNIASFEDLAQTSKGQEILNQFEQLITQYGYLSEVGTDIAVSTWREEPQIIKDLFIRMVKGDNETQKRQIKRKKGFVQERVDLKGRVTEVYSRLLALLRWRFVALEKVWLLAPGEIFFLELEEVKGFRNRENIQKLIAKRRSQFLANSNNDPVPALVYGQAPTTIISSSAPITSRMQGIGASAGQVEGYVLVVRNLQAVGEITRETILVVPYTDSGWSPLLASAGGLIAEVGGRLSHGAIVAREYGIPAIMDVHNAMTLLKNGQRVRIDGQLGIVELL